MESLRRHWIWLLFLFGIAVACAIATFAILASHSLSIKNQNEISGSALLVFTVLAPIVLGSALLKPGTVSIAAAKIHLAFYVAFVFVTGFYQNGDGHSSPFSGIGNTVFGLLIVIMFFEVIVVGAAASRLKQGDRLSVAAPWLATALTAALIGGWGLGFFGWSETNPARVTAAAEEIAGDLPYCIAVFDYAVTKRRQLTGYAMTAPGDNGFRWVFNSVLVVEKPEKAYFNWSHRAGRFDPVGGYTRTGLHLDERVVCRPVSHFARGLM